MPRAFSRFVTAPLGTALIAALVPVDPLAVQGALTEALLYYWVYVVVFVGVSATWFTFAVPLAGLLMRAFGLRTNLHLVGLLALIAACCGLVIAALFASTPRGEMTAFGFLAMTAWASFFGMVSGILHVRDIRQGRYRNVPSD